MEAVAQSLPYAHSVLLIAIVLLCISTSLRLGATVYNYPVCPFLPLQPAGAGPGGALSPLSPSDALPGIALRQLSINLAYSIAQHRQCPSNSVPAANWVSTVSD